jgi:hypothetical protein
MAAFLDLVNELTGTLPGLSPLLARKYVNRALEAIYGERTWSFLQTDGVVVCPAMVTAGTVAITQYSATVTLDATASAALLAQTVVGATPGILTLQLRFGSGPSLGGVYSIIACDATTDPTAIALTLDRVVQETTDADSTYQCYRCLVVPPISDFLKWESFVDNANAISITAGNLTRSSVRCRSTRWIRSAPRRASPTTSATGAATASATP